jgi:hypothetical protein
MRSLLALPVGALFLAICATGVRAEQRIFIIANSPDHGVDHCLDGDAACGAAVATAYCQSKRFSDASSYRRIEREDITGAVPVSFNCGRHGCAEFIAIECRR